MAERGITSEHFLESVYKRDESSSIFVLLFRCTDYLYIDDEVTAKVLATRIGRQFRITRFGSGEVNIVEISANRE